MSCDLGRTGGLNQALLWLQCRPVATAPIQPLAWELPYAVGAGLKRKKKKGKKMVMFIQNEKRMWVEKGPYNEGT